MVKLALEGHDRFELNLYEAEKGTVSYSYDTIRNLNELYPEHEFYFIIGADSLFSIESWKCPQSLLSDCTIPHSVSFLDACIFKLLKNTGIF